jgi:hypothetical protein
MTVEMRIETRFVPSSTDPRGYNLMCPCYPAKIKYRGDVQKTLAPTWYLRRSRVKVTGM